MKMFIIRGLPASGKSTLAKKLIEQEKAECLFEADMYFYKNIVREYRFNPKHLPMAHQWCQISVKDALESGRNVVVANTFTQKWEIKPYLEMAKNLNVEVEIIDVFDGGMNNAELAKRNVHNVPEEAIDRMRKRYETIENNGPFV